VAACVFRCAVAELHHIKSLELAWQGDDGDGSGVLGYGLEHQLDGGSWAVWTTGTPDYTSTLFGLYLEGVHGFRVWTQDGAYHQAWSAEQTVVADRTSPTVTLTLSEQSDYAHVSGNTLYYAENSGSFAVTAALTDTLAGLADVTFPDTTSPGISYALFGATTATRSRTYTFSEGTTEEGAYQVAATDRATNVSTATFTVIRDTTPPQVWLEVPRRVTTATIPLTWGAEDTQSGIARYDVQVSVEDGDWTDWLTGTLETEATYVAEEGEWFAFRVTANHPRNNGQKERPPAQARAGGPFRSLPFSSDAPRQSG